MSVLRVGLAGLGTVGSGVARILASQRELLEQRCGRPIELVAVADRNPAPAELLSSLRPRLPAELPATQQVYFDDPVAMVGEAGLDVLVEALGGTDASLAVAEATLSRGIHLVTANKALLASHGAQLALTAERSGASIGWEAAVGGGIPCIRGLREGCAANQVSFAAGILNGTCNYILSTMAAGPHSFAEVLQEAQRLGYAENPPDLDIDGVDTAHKTALVAAVATGSVPCLDKVYVEGIRAVQSEDVRRAEQMGWSLKLLGLVSRLEDGRLFTGVYPALIDQSSALGGTHGVLNGLMVVGDFVGPVFAQGPGAGSHPTASACVADIMDVARGKAVPVFGVPATTLDAVPQFGSIDDRVGRYYLRGEGVAVGLARAGIGVEQEHEGAVVTASVPETRIRPILTEGVTMIRVEDLPV